MAMADYYQCEVCGSKCFYDANLNWEIDDDTGVWSLDNMGAMAGICKRCAKTHEVLVQNKGGRETEQPAVPDVWSVEERDNTYLILKHDANGEFLKGELIEPELHGHVICELLSDMAHQVGRES